MVTPDELRSLQQPHDEARARRNWDAIQKRRARGGPRLAWLGGGAFAGVALAVALLSWLWPAAAGPLTAAGAEVTGRVHEPSALDDGSRIEVSAETELEVLENTGDRLRLWLHAGRAGFDVTPGGPRRWMIESGQVTVEVLGTSFVVERTADEVRVSVSRGLVLVRGATTPGGLVRLGPGEEVTVPADPAILGAAFPPGPASEPGPPSEPGEATPSEEARSEVREVSIEARAELPSREASAEVPPAPSEADSPSELLDRADVFRREGRYDDAAALLESITRGPAGPEAALAAFTLGRLELERRNHPREAAAAFERAIELGLREPLLEDARARSVEALARTGDRDATHEAAVMYLASHPEGRWVAEVERWAPERP